MEYTVKHLAVLAGVTPRTLRWYDVQGLLPPLRTTEAGYRLYGPQQVDRLQQILFYRELGLELGQIRAILDDPAFDRGAALQSHLVQLEARRDRLSDLILTVQKTIDSEKGALCMSDSEKFEGFKREVLAENHRSYGAELQERYGVEAMAESDRRFAGLTQAQYQAMEATGAEILDRLATAVSGGLDPLEEEGRAIAALHREWLGYTWPSYSPEAHRGLAQMYVEDERFTAYYDKRRPGCAAFLRAAVEGLCS